MIDNSRFLCFSLGKEEYSIPLLSIKEVIGMPDITPIPQSPSHFLGIMNLRGQVISVMDLRQKLSIKPVNTEETSVIILDFGDYNLGVVVDKVNSVQMLSPDEITDKPIVEANKSHEYITGVFRKEEKLILLLDIAKALSVEDRRALAKNSPKPAIAA
jgi:purine-binding chemotaxis protein CheW